MKAVHFAERIIEKFQPRLLVVNMHQADIAHIDFTQYASNLNKMDYALNHLWDTIEATEGMSGETILIAMPEHGRNEEGNGGPPDDYGREPLDHTDLMCREIFALVVGPDGKVKQGKLSSEARESIDIVPTIARILGFDHEPGFPQLPGKVMTESFF
tara:strand:- start:40 stop:510 length:471 start_codon:yes stop_codon:yes gene_type:complete